MSDTFKKFRANHALDENLCPMGTYLLLGDLSPLNMTVRDVLTPTPNRSVTLPQTSPSQLKTRLFTEWFILTLDKLNINSNVLSLVSKILSGSVTAWFPISYLSYYSRLCSLYFTHTQLCFPFIKKKKELCSQRCFYEWNKKLKIDIKDVALKGSGAGS